MRSASRRACPGGRRGENPPLPRELPVAPSSFSLAPGRPRIDLPGGVNKRTMNPGPRPAGTQHADFEALYTRYSREVWALAYARWVNADTALDITQEAFLRLWKQWGAGEQITNP